jgi:hypothetical protein
VGIHSRRNGSFARRLGGLSAALLGATLVVTAPEGARAEAPLFVDWSSLLPGLEDAYIPSSANDCVAGRPRCIDAVIKEMQRRFEPLGRSCHHDAVFALAYLRTTQTYQWAAEQPGFFAEPPWLNHYAAVFAKYYFRSYDDHVAGRSLSVPEAWRIAFDAAAHRQVTASGNLLLGMSAHVNRDLPFVLAAIGLVAPDGTSRKADHDKVNQFLNTVVQPLLLEAAARFDPQIVNIETPHGTGYTALLQTLVGWRERAFRQAERLVAAPNALARGLIEQEIETSAALEARTIVTANIYLPTTSSASRDGYCAAYHEAAAPMAYAFGMPTPYR